MTGDVIKSFLVGLGFDVDEASLAKFNKSIASATLRVTALASSIVAASGAITAGVAGISKDFEQMGYEMHLIAPSINRAIILRQELFKAYSSAGINIVKAAQASVRLNLSLDKTKIVLGAIYKSVGARFFALLTKQSDMFRLKLYQNMPKIQNALEKFVKFIFKALEAVTQLGARLWSILTRVYDFFVMLDKATDGWSTIILGVIAAWKLLNLEFLASPLGMLLAVGIAILALYDDFKTFKEGGKSLFDWTNAIPVIDAVTAAVESLWSVVKSVGAALGAVANLIVQAFSGSDAAFIQALIDTFDSLYDSISKTWDLLKNTFLAGKSLTGALGNLLGGLTGSNVEANIQNNPTVRPVNNPVGSSVQNNNSNQNVSQQTQITVVGASDANAVGKSVAGEQSRVNFDMVRNLKGATR